MSASLIRWFWPRGQLGPSAVVSLACLAAAHPVPHGRKRPFLPSPGGAAMPLALERHPRARCPGLSVGALGLVAGGRELYFASGPKILAAALGAALRAAAWSLAAASRARLLLPAKRL